MNVRRRTHISSTKLSYIFSSFSHRAVGTLCVRLCCIQCQDFVNAPENRIGNKIIKLFSMGCDMNAVCMCECGWQCERSERKITGNHKTFLEIPEGKFLEKVKFEFWWKKRKFAGILRINCHFWELLFRIFFSGEFPLIVETLIVAIQMENVRKLTHKTTIRTNSLILSNKKWRNPFKAVENETV